MASPSITLQSVTGVDVELRIAGAGSRSFAFVIDWHIRLVLALAWLFVGLFLMRGTFNLFDDSAPSSAGMTMVWLPTAVIYFLYHPILEMAMRGSTPGKRMAGVRIVSRTGDIPGMGALLLRNVFRLVDTLPFVYLLGLGAVIFTEHHVRIGDLAAGTLLVHDDTDSAKSLAGLRNNTSANGLTPQSADLVHDLLDRWWTLDDGMRANIARTLIARLDSSTDATALAAQDSPQLRTHLQTLLTGNRPA